jgi:hypothetical protein
VAEFWNPTGPAAPRAAAEELVGHAGDAAALAPVAPEPGLATGEWLHRWLASRVSVRASTSRRYAAHIRGYLVPCLGGIPLAALTAGDVQGMFIAIARDETALSRPVSAATPHRIHATLRAALNGAVRAGLIPSNPGRWPELARATRRSSGWKIRRPMRYREGKPLGAAPGFCSACQLGGVSHRLEAVLQHLPGRVECGVRVSRDDLGC